MIVGGEARTSGLARRVVPCLDTRGGRVVKGVKFQGLRDAGDPAELAARYEAAGADEIVMLDVSATIEERQAELRTVRRVRERLGIPLTVGGGVRDFESAGALLDAGADRVAVNSAAVADPALVGRLAERFGTQCIVVAIDAERVEGAYRVRVASATRAVELEAVAWAREVASMGAGEILLTSIDRDGTREGYDLDLVERVAAAVSVPVVASGGARTPADFVSAARAGAQALLAASLFHDGDFTVADVKRVLLEGGVEVRP
ncbi:imidazole glycerol phosphate synthase subunit HisF [Engelhardtia mirabilis]|uniref:Imidazole glycerol phosphate synthase subunit HisF n=1 Tax=Engelhardtia mirabilis TaxID=2528011 RepID=A0A518BI23_9BACT|nr:Imidazole glycerol phosphate synthase subunit HisF [Planctomycetes bacterium Pla133]QDV00948.1 Imidazole glycerol phosphate synthase subunit HisF [Planctomycetes bacterium Pla86]